MYSLKKIILRPKNFAYFMIYVFAVLFWILAIWMIYEYLFNTESINWVEWLCLFLCPLIFSVFSYHFLQVKIVIEESTVRIIKSMWVKKDKNKKFKIRNILFCHNGRDQKIVTEQFDIDMLEKYGFTKDFKIQSIEISPVLMPMYTSQEIVFIMKDDTISSLNPRPYTKCSIRKLKCYIASQSGLMPFGKLNEL